MQNECYQNKHLLICVVVAIPMLVLYAIVIPLVIMVVLWKAGKDRVTDPSLLIRWGLGKYIKRRSANGCVVSIFITPLSNLFHRHPKHPNKSFLTL